MKTLSAALAAAALFGGIAIGTGPSVATPLQHETTNIIEVSNGWDDGRRHHRRDRWDNDRRGGWDNDRRHRWGHHGRRHNQWGHYRPHQRCHTEWVVQWGYYGAQWVPVQRCYRGW